MTLLSTEYEQQKSDTGPRKLEISYPGYNDKVKVEQSAGINFFVAGANIERSFDARSTAGTGYTNLKDKASIGVLIGRRHWEVHRSSDRLDTRDSFDVSIGMKFIIGVELGFSFGRTTDIMTND